MIMTEKLYYKNSYLISCESKITDIKIIKDNAYLILDKTVFFPTGGGQPCDSGYINNYLVSDVSETDGIILHQLENFNNDLSIGDIVTCKIDSRIRFERMRAHSGEHILSGIAHNLFSLNNVGFHMDDDFVMTVDFDRYLTKSELLELEDKVNRVIRDNFQIKTIFFDKQSEVDFDYRSKIDIDGVIRIVEIEGIDKCACCAPHVRTTSEVTLLKILSCISHRGGCRLTVICGNTAFNDYCLKHNEIINISTTLCSKHTECDAAVNNLLDKNLQLSINLKELNLRLLKHIASSLPAENVAVSFFEELTSDDLRIIANLIADKHILIALFSGNDNSGYAYCFYSERIDLSDFAKQFNSALNGRGGGRGNLIQGRVNSPSEFIKAYLEKVTVKYNENA